MKIPLLRLLALSVLIASLALTAFADTIHLKDGTVMRGQIIGFKDQQFTVLLLAGARGRRSRVSLYMEDVDFIEFDNATAAAGVGGEDNVSSASPSRPANRTSGNTQGGAVSQPASFPGADRRSPTFFQVRTRVRGDAATNGWTNSGLVVRRGQRLRISATGRVSLGNGRVSTPAGLANVPDKDKLMRTQPTGGLIAVIGDDNDEFIFVGQQTEFVALRDGVLFLGVNEGNLADNNGAYDVVIEAEALSNLSR